MAQVESAIQDHIAVVTLGGTAAAMLDTSFCQELDEVLYKHEKNDDVHVLVVTSATPGLFLPKFSRPEMIAFCEELRAKGKQYEDDDEPASLSLDKICNRAWNMRKPIIAAINGDCLGGAYEFALSCDYRIMEDANYLIGLHEAQGGIFPGAGGTQRLTKLVGKAIAFKLLINGEKLSPEKALGLHLIDEVVRADAVSRAVELAREWSKRGNPRALGDIKMLVRVATEQSMSDGLRMERNRFSNHVSSDWNHRRITQTAQARR